MSPLDLVWPGRRVRDVPASEAARHDLYNLLIELLGPQQLMAALPAYDTSERVSKHDLALVWRRVEE